MLPRKTIQDHWSPDIQQSPLTNPVRSLQAKQLELERQQATDSLRKGLERRPEKEELIERRNIPTQMMQILGTR